MIRCGNVVVFGLHTFFVPSFTEFYLRLLSLLAILLLLVNVLRVAERRVVLAGEIDYLRIITVIILLAEFARKNVGLVRDRLPILGFNLFSKLSLCFSEGGSVILGGVVVCDTKVKLFERTLSLHDAFHVNILITKFYN
jgi:hypothetical protein